MHRTSRAQARAVLLLAAVVGLAFPIALASAAPAQQTSSTTTTTDPDADRWDQSVFTFPADRTAFFSDSALATIKGKFIYEKSLDVERITSVRVTVKPDPDADPPFHPDCNFPDPVDLAPESEPNPTSPTDTFPFEVIVPLPCNGPYKVTADAVATNNHFHTMKANLGVSTPPEPVSSLKVTTGESGTTHIVWTPPEPEPLDIVGYIVERAGPHSTSAFDTISGILSVLEYDDQVADNGTYIYRARPLRRAAEGTVIAAPGRSPTRKAEVTTAPTTTTTTTAPKFTGAGTLPTPTQPPQRTLPSLPKPPTTVDTGFGELDYGDREQIPAASIATLPDQDDPLAGASIVQTDDEPGAGLLIPAAGALVLAVWAGHLVYINRLARDIDLPEISVD